MIANLFASSLLDKSVAAPSPLGYHGGSAAKHPFEPQPEPPVTPTARPKKDFRLVLVVLIVALLLGLLLAVAYHWRPGQDVQPKAHATIQYEPLESVGGPTAAGGGGEYHRVLERVRAWKARRK